VGHYKSNVRDLEFNLFEVFGRQDVLGRGIYEDVDVDAAKDILTEVARLAENELADSLVDSDRNPPVYDPATHSVTMPESFRKSFRAYVDGGWGNLDVPAELGGMVVPPSLRWSVAELVCGANPAIHMFAASYSFASLLYHLGTDDQKKLAKHIVDHAWHTTMVLTEPDAGSDVGAGRAKATQQPDGTWHIEGVKRFITSGDSDLTDNVIHFVLARPEGAGPGTKGLSLFIVPKFHVDLETGELGERNGVNVTNVEHKMGLKVSPTCEVTFGDGAPAVGTLLGDVHDGIAQMFTVIEHARMTIGVKATGTLSTGYLNALEYAKTRVQGADMTQMTDKTAPRVTILHHPDVRRSLMTQKAYAEGLRALYLYAAAHQNADVAQLVSGADAGLAHRVDDLLLPVVKGVGSERAYEILTESLQTLGGSGFLQDYPIEQYIRDAKIDSLYEGTTAIQAMDFFFRKIVRDKGQALAHVATQVGNTIDACDAGLKKQAEQLRTALDDVQAMTATLTGYLMAAPENPTEIYKVGLVSVRYLLAVGDLLIGWRLLAQANVATTALAEGKEEDFYRGKIATAAFFMANMLPTLTAVRSIVEQIDDDIMTLPEAAF
jgi:alkylation response protein AidB-like acyl-CoA dehydrogenase